MDEHHPTPNETVVHHSKAQPGHGSRFSLSDLARASGVPERTIRFYIQQGLVPRPEGSKRGSYYEAKHLEALLTTARLVASGLSLSAVARMVEGGLDQGFR